MLSAAAMTGALLPLSLGLATSAAHATTALTLPFGETFTSYGTDDNWTVPPTPDGGSNPACLTEGVDSTPIPACESSSAVPGLQLTDNGLTQSGGVAYSVPVSTIKPLEFAFNSYQFNAFGSAGDGIAFFLAAVDPTNEGPLPLDNIGPGGGSLGYSGIAADGESPAVPGVPHAYLGVGLDVYGNFATPLASGAQCIEDHAFAPQSVVIRGPGNQGTGYCLLQAQTLSAPSETLAAAAPEGVLDAPFFGSATREARPPGAEAPATGPYPAVPVVVVVNPRNTVITTSEGIQVPARSLVVSYDPLDGPPQEMVQPLPGTSGGPVLQGGAIPSAWLNSTTGIPQQLVFGFTAGTGSAGEVHEVSDLTVRDISAPELRFTVGPLDTAVNASMKDPGATTNRVLRVRSFPDATSTTPNTTLAGKQVTLAFQDAPAGAKFVVNGVPKDTMTATANAQGIASFTPIVINTAGFDYSLRATGTGTHFPAVSNPFTVAEVAKSCTSDDCTITPPPTDNAAATAKGKTGDIITATFGGDGIAPLLGCDNPNVTYTEILTVTGNKPKVVRMQIDKSFVPNRARFAICFSSPKPFEAARGRQAQQNPDNNNWYEGYLHLCHEKDPGPCIVQISWSKGKDEFIAIWTGAADPRIML
jgi:hypothetical protein